MLIYYRFNNFCSFNCDSEFSMNAPGGKVMRRFPDNYVETEEGFDLLKSAVIVGENAGGKSNFINSLRYLKSLFVTNTQVKSLRPYVNAVSLNNDEQPIQKFELCFRASNKRIYFYELKINDKGIVFEKLQYAKNKKATPALVFETGIDSDGSWYAMAPTTRDISMSLNRYILGEEQSNNVKIGLFVSVCALLGDPDALAVVDWVTNTLYPESLASKESEDIIKQDADMRILEDEKYLQIFRMVDYSICGIQIDKEKPYSKTIIIRKDENGNEFKRELQLDSTGVREFFAWAVHIFRVVYENKVVFADEMDRVLNPILSDRVISFINGTEHNGQFVFSTHNVLHLDLKNYMKEQIYFVTKNREELTSEIYSLSDFPEVRYETTKIYEFYLKGILGGTAFE